MHLPPRSSCRGTDTQAAREQPAKPPAGTALAPMTRCASASCPSKERGLYGNWNKDRCQEGVGENVTFCLTLASPRARRPGDAAFRFISSLSGGTRQYTLRAYVARGDLYKRPVEFP